MSRPLLARLDAAALAHNLAVARQAAPGAKILAVIKANGYGHGLLRVARALRAADGFAVLSIDEAAQLRGEGYTHPIALLEGFFHPDELPDIARLRLRPVIHRQDQAEILARARLEHKVDVFLKVDTGMHRLGLSPKRLADVLAVLRAAPQVGSLTLMTHFARADEDPASVAAQFALFREATAGLDLPVSLANSAALLRHPETHGDWVRPGIMLYGASPFAAQTGADLGLLPAMTLESRLIATRFVRKGEGVGYGAAYVAERDMQVGVVACGYADGYPRHAGTGTPLVVAGRETRTLGRVSMDMLFADLSGVPGAHVGSPVTLWGAGLPAERVAAAAGTIAYELFTALAPRVPVEEY
ncbi:MAG TPA: alanine racemase [Thiobacillaceae bacterium]|nr:alanine racemase [Thiobacillaceae bacterium]HNF90257.1 alanine racemase [Thiobacillaceae bacterium]